MKKYRVNVNGTVYEVELEEITGGRKAAALPASARAAEAARPRRGHQAEAGTLPAGTAAAARICRPRPAHMVEGTAIRISCPFPFMTVKRRLYRAMKKAIKCMAGILALTLAFVQVAPVSAFAEHLRLPWQAA